MNYILHDIMIYLFLFILGLLFGSFGSVLSYRLGDFLLGDMWEGSPKLGQALKGIAWGRSKCPHCAHTLHAIDLLPIISYLSTGGKCRYCKRGISIRYPILEIGCGLLFVWIGYVVGPLDISYTHSILWILLSWIMYLLIIFDVETMYLHEPLWLIGAILALGLLMTSPTGAVYYSLQWGLLSTLFFLGLYWFARLYVWIKYHENKEGFGMGDVRLAPIIGIQFGLMQTRYVETPLFLDSFSMFRRYVIIAGILGLVYAGIHKLSRPTQSSSSIPFFPGMIVALWIIMAIVSL